MHIHTKFLRLRKTVPIGDRIDDWRVCGSADGTKAESSSSLWYASFVALPETVAASLRLA